MFPFLTRVSIRRWKTRLASGVALVVCVCVCVCVKVCGWSPGLTRDRFAGGGVVYTWGASDYGRLGHGDTIDVLSPQRVASLPRVVSIAAGFDHALAVTGVFFCVRVCSCVCDDCFSGRQCVRVGQRQGWQTRCR